MKTPGVNNWYLAKMGKLVLEGARRIKASSVYSTKQLASCLFFFSL